MGTRSLWVTYFGQFVDTDEIVLWNEKYLFKRHLCTRQALLSVHYVTLRDPIATWALSGENKQTTISKVVRAAVHFCNSNGM